MRDWFVGIVGEDYATIAQWVAAAAVIALLLFIFQRVARGYGSGTFVVGGKNRKTRLAVMDATAIDGHRRLVLVRRDDTEHLILIGGPTDVVVEQNIRAAQMRPVAAPAEPEPASAPDMRPAPPAAAVQPQPRPQSQPARPVQPMPAPDMRPRPLPQPSLPPAPQVAPAPLAAPVFERPPQPQFDAPVARPRPIPDTLLPAAAAVVAAPVAIQDAPHERTVPLRDMPIAPEPAVRVAPTVDARPVDAAPVLAPPIPPLAPRAPEPETDMELDDDLLQELETSLEREAAPAVRDEDPSLEDEMKRLLGDLTTARR